MGLIEQGIEKGLISFDDEQKYITYHIGITKKCRYTDPEEQVQAETLCQLVIDYGYPAHRITVNEAVTIGSKRTEADIILYNDDARTQPHIVVECKHKDVSEAEFRQAVEQAFSYANAIAGTTKYVWVTKGNKEQAYLVDKEKNIKEEIAAIPHHGQVDTPPFKYVKGGKLTQSKIRNATQNEANGSVQDASSPSYTAKPRKYDDLETIAESDLIRIFKQCHDSLWAGGELNPSQAFDELDKLIFCKIWDEKNTDKGHPYLFQIYRDDTPHNNTLTEDEKNKIAARAIQKRIDGLYEKGKEKDPEVFNKPIDLTPERVQMVVRYLQKINLTKTDLDSKGKAFETFLGTYFRGEFGQYFTPRAVVKMMIEALPMHEGSKVLDTSCGSGGFLLYALDKVRQQADKKYEDYKTDPDERELWKKHWHDFAEKRLFGIEINESIARVAKMNMIIHDDGHTNVIAFDGLHDIDYMQTKTKNQGFTPNSFDFIVTNPPFGSVVRQSEKSYMQVDSTTAPYYDFALKEVNWIDAAAKGKHLTTGRENQSTEVLFIEQCHKFLKEGGYMAVVIPDGILTNSSLQYVRDGIERKFRIVAVISLPQTTFSHTGAGVKSSVLFLKKHTATATIRIKNLQEELQAQLKTERQLQQQYKDWDAAKKRALKALLKAEKGETIGNLFDDDTLKPYIANTKTQDIALDLQAVKDAINEDFNEKWTSLAEQTVEDYKERLAAAQTNYPILMAIADNIGYDATGKDSTRLLDAREETVQEGNKTTHYRIEHREHDLFELEIRKERNEKGEWVTKKETIIPETGIVGELKRFIEHIAETE